MVEAPPRPPLSLDLDVDVCVIGGGLAGLTTAREVARSGWSVVLLEAGRLAAERLGPQYRFRAAGFWRRRRQARRPRRFRTHQGFVVAVAGRPRLCAQHDPRRRRARHRSARRLALRFQKRQQRRIRAAMSDCSANWAARSRAGRPSGCARCCAASATLTPSIICGRFTIHPLNYALALAAAAERDGARIFENTPALSIDPTGVRKRIVTPGARLRANHVVLCGNVQLGALMPRLAATLVPVTTYVITTAPLGERLAEAVGYRGGVSDTDLADNHYRIVGGDRLDAVGPFDGVGARSAPLCRRADRPTSKRPIRSLATSRSTTRGPARLGITMHRMPQIGELGPGVWLASGFGGHGLNTTAMAGNIIARAIVDGDRDLAAIHAVRTGVGGRRVRPRGGADARLDQTAARRASRSAAPRPANLRTVRRATPNCASRQRRKPARTPPRQGEASTGSHIAPPSAAAGLHYPAARGTQGRRRRMHSPPQVASAEAPREAAKA